MVVRFGRHTCDVKLTDKDDNRIEYRPHSRKTTSTKVGPAGIQYSTTRNPRRRRDSETYTKLSHKSTEAKPVIAEHGNKLGVGGHRTGSKGCRRKEVAGPHSPPTAHQKLSPADL